MLLPLGFQAEVGQIGGIIRSYFDGVGNPRSRRRRHPALARIVAIAQAFDNLTVDMRGHQPTSIDEAFRQILLQSRYLLRSC